MLPFGSHVVSQASGKLVLCLLSNTPYGKGSSAERRCKAQFLASEVVLDKDDVVVGSFGVVKRGVVVG